MDIGIVTVAFNDYGRFLPQWCKSISELWTPPSAVTVALGKKHGLTTEALEEARSYTPQLKVVRSVKVTPTMGNMRNVAVKNTDTEWIQYLSIDDLILPWAIDEYSRFAEEADFISIKWQSSKEWIPDSEVIEHQARIPEQMAKNHQGRGFIVNHSPYRRSLWENRPYLDHDYPNAPFVADCVEQGARFVVTERPCTHYLRRLDSHCGKNLGRRKNAEEKPTTNRKEKKKANFWKRDSEKRIREYYKRKK